MISAVEALCLPHAKLSPSDAEATASYIVEIEEQVRQTMARVGCTIPIDPKRVNPIIAAEIERHFRERGWRAEFQKAVSKSMIGGQTIAFQLALAPTDESYAEADRKIRESAGN